VSGWSSENLQEAFYITLSKSPTNLCICVDGLDASGDNMHEYLTFFQSKPKQTNTQARHRICSAIRPEAASILFTKVSLK